MSEQFQPPDPQLYWNRKWKLAIAGMCFSVFSIIAGLLIVLFCGKEYGSAVTPIAIGGMWGGMFPIAAYAAEAATENIAQMRGK